MNIAGRIFRRLLSRLARRGRPGGRALALALVAAAIVIAAGAFELPDLPLPRGGPSGGFPVSAANEPTATAAYLRGQQGYDARLIWQSYSERVRRDIERRGGSVEDTQRQLERMRDTGARIESVQYVGSYTMPTGSMHFYVVARAGGTRGDLQYQPYTFTLDSQGKIERIE